MTLSLAPRAVGLRRLAALAASTVLAVAPALQAGPPAPQAGATGTIKGQLVWAAGPIPAPKEAVKKGDPKVKDDICKAKTILNKEITVDPATKGVANGIAYIVAPAADFTPDEKALVTAAEKALLAKTPSVVIDQINCEYVPYASVVHKDQKLTFKSSDPVGHNVDFKPFNNPAINPMLPPNGKTDYPIKKAERRPYPVNCSIHPWMTGYVFISDNPFAVVTKADGSFEISGVPAGKRQLVVWHSRGYATPNLAKGLTVDVPAGGTADVGQVQITK